MEVFKDIKGYEGSYKISNLGRVKSLKRNKETILKDGISGCGYKTVGLYSGRNRKTFKVHQLVAIEFLNHDPKKSKLVVDHIDNNKLNNNLTNLQIVTHRYNSSKDTNSGSKYTGVSLHKLSNKWISNITLNGKQKYLGLFKCELAAAKAYNDKLKEITNV